ncbi:sensor histidine kinase [Floridanema aerugineum]|jgi:signal transduction histidine kinase|uniref:histidine kinase n=1 Tax=Floridaenema aerugineum BLCC-F46 TaxID=3153654 RepID=A0ABV4X1R9_9CYAN
MFNKIRDRLLCSYLFVLASILIISALAVRVVFVRSLAKQQTEKLIALAEGVAANGQFYQGNKKFENEYFLRDLAFHNQALQWFNPQGKLIAQQGQVVLNLPIPVHPEQKVQFQTDKIAIEGVTLRIISSNNGQLIGYIRASQSLKELNETIQKLDFGLGGGIVMALVLSGVGGVFLTRQAMQPIEQSFQRLKQFTADASHELRSPLMAIKSNAAVALKYPEGMRSTDAEKFQAIANATDQMSRLTEDLLFLARTDNVNSHDWDRLDLTAILNNLIELYQPQAAAKQIDLLGKLADNLYVLGDSVQLIRLFTNLLQNAIHYTPEGGKITIKASHFGTYIEVKVRDTGVGIAPEHLKQVFERFWRADQSRSYWKGGCGLGLSIAQAIAQKHDGEITLTSQLGIGSCFIVCLPANNS